MSYKVPQHIDKNKIFIVNRSEIEGRLEPEFYKPSIACLEAKIRSLSSKKLRDYALSFAGGVTPKKSEGDKYYSDAENGVPFLRVQNLQTTGELFLDGCIYINEDTHNGLLKRSQVSEGDLLIKITGVGRMAIASVAPKNFVGNTNQHMVVVKTGNVAISKYLAHYLNLDIIEKIASRHSTGGTRPALDYPSLKNLPVIEGLDFSLIDDAIKAKKAKEEEAKQLLNSIDDYLLNELGIELPQHKTDLSSRIYYIQKSNCIERFDPKYNKQLAYIKSLHGSYIWVTLKDIAINTGQYGANEPAIDFKDGDVRYIRITDIDELGNLKEYDKKTAGFIEQSYFLQEGDILFARSGSVGKCYIHRKNVEPAIFAGYLIRYKLDTKQINPWYLFFYCNSSIYKYWIDTIQRPAVQANINAEEYKTLPIPLPTTLSKQNEIVDYIKSIRRKAKSLQEEGKVILERAKREVERMIIGDDNI